MTTPNKKKPPKRHDPNDRTWAQKPAASTTALGLNNPEYATRLASIVTEFEHLEDHMSQVLAVLMNADTFVAGYILRSIRAPRGRFDVMRDLLEKAAWNSKLGVEWDDLLGEYWAIGRARNKFVHGRWYTELDDKQTVYFVATDDHGFALFAAKPLKLKELDDVIGRIRAMTLRMFKTSAAGRLVRLGREVPAHLLPPAESVMARSKTRSKGLPRRILKARRKKLIREAAQMKT